MMALQYKGGLCSCYKSQKMQVRILDDAARSAALAVHFRTRDHLNFMCTCNLQGEGLPPGEQVALLASSSRLLWQIRSGLLLSSWENISYIR